MLLLNFRKIKSTPRTEIPETRSCVDPDIPRSRVDSADKAAPVINAFDKYAMPHEFEYPTSDFNHFRISGTVEIFSLVLEITGFLKKR